MLQIIVNFFINIFLIQNMLSNRVDKEKILVGKIIWGDRKLEDSVLRTLLVSSPNRNICL